MEFGGRVWNLVAGCGMSGLARCGMFPVTGCEFQRILNLLEIQRFSLIIVGLARGGRV